MPNIKFTQDAVDRLPPPIKGRIYYWDLSHPGFGIRITARNHRVWIAMYRVDGQQIMETIATTAELPSLKQACDRAMKSKLHARSGVDPTSHRRGRKKKQMGTSFRDVCERYLTEYVELNCRPKTIRETRRIMEHDIYPTLGDRALTEITRFNIRELLQHKATKKRELPRLGTTKGAVAQANRDLARLKTFFRWCMSQDVSDGVALLDKDPTFGIRPNKEESRKRELYDTEIRAFWHACDVIGHPYGPMFKLLLLTAQRRNEVADMRRSELNLDKSMWTLPADRVKNGKEHFVPLSPMAQQIIETLPASGSDLVFGRLSNFGVSKRRLDTAMTLQHGAEVQHWTLHDLRRTATTGMASLGIAHHVTDKILNHTAGKISGTEAVYNKYEYLAERRDALNLWAQHIHGLVKRATLNV